MGLMISVLTRHPFFRLLIVKVFEQPFDLRTRCFPFDGSFFNETAPFFAACLIVVGLDQEH